MWKRVAMAMFVASVGVASASAQTAPAGQQPAPAGQQPPASGQATMNQQPAEAPVVTRRATTTFRGDTGLWFVPTGDVLPAGRWSVSAYRVNFDYNQGFTDISNWPITIGVGLGDRAEVFGAVDVVRRIDRDVRPLFTSDPRSGGLVNDYPFVSEGWSGNQFGDVWLGAKVNLASQWRQQPAAFALRGLIKLPTASDDDEGVGTGKVDFAIDAIASREINERVELSGYAGMMFRGDPDGAELSNGLRWGVGAGFPTRRNLRLTAELHGEALFDDTLSLSRSLIGADGTIAGLLGASPGASTSCCQKCVRRSALPKAPSFSTHIAEGRMRSAPALLTVG